MVSYLLNQMLNQSLTIRVFLPLSPQTTGLGRVSRRSTTRCVRVSSVELSAPKPSAALPLVERGATPVSSALPSHTLADGVSSPTSALEPAKVRLEHTNDLEDLFNFFLTVMRETITIINTVVIQQSDAIPSHDILESVLTMLRNNSSVDFKNCKQWPALGLTYFCIF